MPDPKPFDLKALANKVISEDPSLAPAKTVTLKNEVGQTLQVPESERYDHLGEGYDDPREPESGQPMGFGQGLLARGEALDRGATFGIGGQLGSLGAGAVNALTAPDRAVGPGLDAPLQEKGAFRQGYEEAEAARKQRAEDLGLEGYGWEAAGGIGAALATGGGSLAAKALAKAPAALTEKLGTKIASKIIGDEAAQTALKFVAGRAASGAIEGGISAGVGAAAEQATTALENPGEAAQNVLLGMAAGTGLGAVLGGGFGLVEGVSRTLGNKAPEVMASIEAAAQPPPPVPAVRPVSAIEAVEQNAVRPMTAAQIPDPPRNFAKTWSDRHAALTGGTEASLEEGTRAVTQGLTDFQKLAERAQVEIGIAQKRVVNNAAASEGWANQLSDMVDTDDVARIEATRANAAEMMAKHEAGQATVAETRARLAQAQANEAAARQALDDADVPGIRPGQKLGKEGAIEETTRLARPGSKALRPQREALAAAAAETKRAAKELMDHEAAAAAHAANHEAAQGLMTQTGAPRRLTVVEASSRDMFDGMLDGVRKFKGQVAGAERSAAAQLEKQLLAHLDIVKNNMREGAYGEAYNSLDQGTRNAIKDFINSAPSQAAETFGIGLYNVPKDFLEDTRVWGKLAEMQKQINPVTHEAALASLQPAYKGLFVQGADAHVKGWGAGKVGNSASVNGLLQGIGTSRNETTEVAARQALRANVKDWTNKVNVWGSDSDIAKHAATIGTHLEDTLDHVALSLRDRAVMQNVVQSGTSIMTLGALGGAVTGNAAVGIPFVAGRWLLGSIAKYRGNIAQKIVQGTTKLVNSGVSVGTKVGKISTQGIGRKISTIERQESLEHAAKLSNVASPEFGALALESAKTDAISPGLGSAMMQHELTKAQLIQERLPKAPSAAVFSPKPRLTTAAATQLDRIIQATRSPAKTFDKILNGAATPEDLDAMRRLYPEPYKMMTDSIMAELQKPKRRSVGSSEQMYLSRVVGQPLTPALMNIADAQMRAKKATNSAEDAGKPEGQGDNGSDGRTFRAKMDLKPDDVYGSRADAILTEDR